MTRIHRLFGLALIVALLLSVGWAETFSLPQNTQIIEAEAFRDCVSLTGQLTIQPGVTAIGDYAFAGCTGLTGLPVISETVAVIGAHAFDGCTGLSGTLFISPDVDLDDTAFANCPNLTVTRESGIKVAVVGDAPDPTGDDFNGSVWRAAHAFCQENGLEHYYFSIDYSQDEENPNLGEVLDALDNGFDTVIGIGYMVDASLAEIAGDYPDTRFVFLDEKADDPGENTLYMSSRNDQSGFLAGYAAVKMGYRRLGFMGGMQIPPVEEYGQGFVQGVNAAAVELGIADSVSVAYTYTGTFAPNDEVQNLAEAWYENDVEVIFACGGAICNSIAQAATEANGKMIGVDEDQAYLMPNGGVITSAMKNLNSASVYALDRILDGDWESLRGRNVSLGIISSDPEENFVKLPASTAFNASFTQSDYQTLVGRLYSGALSTNGDIQISVMEPTALRVAVVGDAPEPAEDDFNGAVWRAASAFCQENGLAGAYYDSLSDALSANSEIVIAVGFDVSGEVAQIADQNPDVKFICLDNEEPITAQNVYVIDYRNDQAGFLAGYAAVKMGYRRLGFMGGMEIPSVQAFGQGFAQGADAAAIEMGIPSDVSVAYTYTGVFWPDTDAMLKAYAWYGNGVEAIFACGGGLCQSVVQAAQDMNGKLIGVDEDQAYLMPNGGVITSAMKDIGPTSAYALGRILAGEWANMAGRTDVLGIISSDPDQNFVKLPASTAFNASFTQADYQALVGRLYRNELAMDAALQISVDDLDPEYTVSSATELQALGSILTGVVHVRSTNNEPVDLAASVRLAGEVRVEAQGNFSSLRIVENGSLTLIEGAKIGSYSVFDPANPIGNQIAQVWLEGGSLDASEGEMADWSTLYIRGGTYSLPQNHGVYLIGGAMNEAMLRGFLANPEIDEVFIQQNITLTEDLTIAIPIQVMDGAVLTVPNGRTVTVRPGGSLNETDGQVNVQPGGQVIREE